jgi:pSer/pThr/pTyr-binding forkhead associated (FHA) protein
MPQVPNISVQLIHIQGPLKGQIQDFSQFPVKIGRHSSCQVRFDKDLTTISRRHARIERHGNRFRIIDASTNGTYVNGKRIADVYLRDGDVITFSDNGPKASFLTKIEAAEAPVPVISRQELAHTGPSTPAPVSPDQPQTAASGPASPPTIRSIFPRRPCPPRQNPD